MEKQPFEDVFPIEHGDFPLSYNKFAEGYRVYRFSVILCFNSHGWKVDETSDSRHAAGTPARMKLYPHHQHHGPTFLVPLLMGWWFFSWICDLSFNDGLVAMGIHGRQISKRNLLTIWLGWRYVRIAAVLSRYQHVPTVYVMRLDIICATQHSSWD